jgi:hypothetical protein
MATGYSCTRLEPQPPFSAKASPTCTPAASRGSPAVRALPVRSCVIDGELIAAGARLEALFARRKGDLIRFSESFPDRRCIAGGVRTPRPRVQAEGFGLSIRPALRLGQGKD